MLALRQARKGVAERENLGSLESFSMSASCVAESSGSRRMPATARREKYPRVKSLRKGARENKWAAAFHKRKEIP